MNTFSCVLHISNYKKQFSTFCPYLTKTIISQCRTYNVPNLCIYLPIFSVFNTICYSFMVHSFHRAASILLPVLTIVTGILKMLSNIFCRDLYCDGINMFSSGEFSHIRDFSIFWFISRFYDTSISILFLQRFKTQCREIFLNT